MEHDDARDPERRTDDATPTDPIPADPTPADTTPADTAGAAEVPPLDATWPQQDVATPATERTDTWPERVEPEPVRD